MKRIIAVIGLAIIGAECAIAQSRKLTCPLLKRSLIIVAALFCFNTQAQSIGTTNISSGPATWVEGVWHLASFAPGTDSSITYDGNWHAIISDKGIQITMSDDVSNKFGDHCTLTESMIGEDQFELVTEEEGKKQKNFQEGAIRTIENGMLGPSAGMAQYILERIAETSTSTNKQNPIYGASWFYLVKDLKADTKSGLHVQRSNTLNAVQDKWYVSQYVSEYKKGSTNEILVFPAGYSTNGFLALKYEGNFGKITTGETFRVQEYGTKSKPSSDEDVYQLHDTKMTVTDIRPVSDVNLLPVVQYDKAEITDHRLMEAPSEPLIVDFSETQWITRNSPGMRLLEEQLGKSQGFR